MKLPNFLKPRTASLEELRAQLEHAKTLLENAQASVSAAQGAFDDDGAASSEKALLAARDAERSASEHVARAERLLASAEQAHAEAERKQRERRVAEIEALLADRTRVAELDAAEVARWLAIVEARQARQAEAQRRVMLEVERREIMFALGDSSLASVMAPSSDPGVYQIAEALMAEATKSGPGARQSVLLELARPLRPPAFAYTFVPPAQRIPVDDTPWGHPLLGRPE